MATKAKTTVASPSKYLHKYVHGWIAAADYEKESPRMKRFSGWVVQTALGGQALLVNAAYAQFWMAVDLVTEVAVED